jgi:uncharacterized protein involved in response to NO
MDARVELPGDAALRQALSPRLLAAAPHRLLFFVGAAERIAGNGLVGGMAGVGALAATVAAAPAERAGGLDARHRHAVPGAATFHLRFLLTVFPRLARPGTAVALALLPIGLGLFGGQLLVLAALWSGSPGPALARPAAEPGRLERGAGVPAVAVAARERESNWHARSCAAAAAAGLDRIGTGARNLYTGNAT